LIDEDLAAGRNGGRVVTRFPPEPNGYLHLGHAKSITINFGLAAAYKGVTHMRLDDTNPAKEEIEYVNSILEDVRWLVSGDNKEVASSLSSAPWFGPVRHASDYFHTIYDAATYLIEKGLAYVDDLTQEEMREYRGSLTEPGKDSPYRTRSIEENLRLFKSMKNGELPDGQCILRAKIDMTHPNMIMRDPALYRIKRAPHPMTGDKWCIYPMYDFAHAISDALEGITHSLCTLEFADHRPLYDWTIDALLGSGLLPGGDKGWRPVQTEFSRLNLQYTVLSKRKLIQLVTEKYVEGWDDPRMPTISGVRRRGYPPAAIRLFCDRMGVSKAENNIDIAILEDCVREVLDEEAERAFALLEPLKVTITNYPVSSSEIFSVERHPKRSELGTRDIPFTSSLFINSDDFFDTGIDGKTLPPKGYKRLVPGGQVRLKYAYVITCDEVIRDASTGKVLELKCSYDERTRAGVTPEGAKKAKGIIQWLSAEHAVPAELVLYDRLFTKESPGKDHEDGDFLKDLNPNSMRTFSQALVEPSLGAMNIPRGVKFQFERIGYFCLDSVGNTDVQKGAAGDKKKKLRFNRTVTLKDTWATNAADEASEATKAVASATAIASPSSVIVASSPEEEDVLRVEMRVGVILSAEKHPDADSLYVEQIDVGDSKGPRTVISGLAKFIPIEKLVGKKVVVICNLKPSKMRGIVSEGMVLAGSSGQDENEVVELVEPPSAAVVGELVEIQGYAKPRPDVQLKSKSALDAWKRAATLLAADGDGKAIYGSKDKPRKLTTSAGECFLPTLKSCVVR